VQTTQSNGLLTGKVIIKQFFMYSPVSPGFQNEAGYFPHSATNTGGEVQGSQLKSEPGFLKVNVK